MKATIPRSSRTDSNKPAVAQSRRARKLKPAIDLPKVIGDPLREEDSAALQTTPQLLEVAKRLYLDPSSGGCAPEINSAIKSEGAAMLFRLCEQAREMKLDAAITHLEGLSVLLEGNVHTRYERAAILLLIEGYRRLEAGLALEAGRALVPRHGRPDESREYTSVTPLSEFHVRRAVDDSDLVNSDPDSWDTCTRHRWAMLQLDGAGILEQVEREARA